MLQAEKGGQTGAKSAFETQLAKLRSGNSSIRADFSSTYLTSYCESLCISGSLERGSHEGDGRCHGALSTELCFTVFCRCGNTVKS